MISFLLCLAILVGGYFVYGKIVDNTFGPDDRETPAVRINDGVDYVVMPQWKLFLVQLLNIAGLGPIFGAMQGALWGPVVFLWITFGTIFAGGVHDYFSGMMSERNDGASIAEITGKYLGPVMQNVMRVFSVVLLIMVGTVFAVGPAGLIVELCSQSGASGVMTSLLFWLVIMQLRFQAAILQGDTSMSMRQKSVTVSRSRVAACPTNCLPMLRSSSRTTMPTTRLRTVITNVRSTPTRDGMRRKPSRSSTSH